MTYEFSEPTNRRGFASMDEEQQRAIASKGGRAVSEDRQHMAEIGRKGGQARGSNLGSSTSSRSSGSRSTRGGSSALHAKAGRAIHKSV